MIKAHGKKILICPLNWGLGHATRCIPVIRELLARDINVIICADGGPLELLKIEFPKLAFIEFPGYKITYPEGKHMALKMLMSLPAIISGIYKEHRELNKIIRQYGIDAVISDNRYGLWSKKIPSVFITHQLRIKCPPSWRFLEPVLFKINKYIIERYHECWVPDYAGAENLSAELSHISSGLNIPLRYIGPLSRFEHGKAANISKRYDLMVILSGPEPQRTIFEKKVMAQLKQTTLKTIVVRGIPGAKPVSMNGFEIHSHLETGKMQEAIHASDIILSRPGYSTIMDLAVLGKKAILVPTPGQTEQEYLAHQFHQKKIYYSVSQEKLNIEEAILQLTSP